MSGPVDPAEIVRDRNLRRRSEIGEAHGRSRHPRAVVDQPVEVVEVAVRELHRIAQRTAVGRLAQDALPHAFRQQRSGDVGVEILVEQRDQPADLGTLGGGAVDHRRTLDRFLEILSDRAAIGERDVLFRIDDHRRAPGRIEVEEHVGRGPGVFAHQFEWDVLFAQQQPELAAEGAQRELMEEPHGGASMPQIRRGIHAFAAVSGEEITPPKPQASKDMTA